MLYQRFTYTSVCSTTSPVLVDLASAKNLFNADPPNRDLSGQLRYQNNRIYHLITFVYLNSALLDLLTCFYRHQPMISSPPELDRVSTHPGRFKNGRYIV